MNSIQKYCGIIRSRSEENEKSVLLLHTNGHYGQVMSILRQELDSMVRCIYLLNFSDLTIREILTNQTLDGERWRYPNRRIITDRDMVKIANELQGWTASVYKFGCSFIHLSNFHNYKESDPFLSLEESEKNDIKFHLNQYHGYNLENELTFESIKPYLFQVFDKVKGNLLCYVESLEQNELTII